MDNLKIELTKHYNKLLNDTLKRFDEEYKKSDKLTRVEKYTLNRKTPYKKNRVEQVKNRVVQIYKNGLSIELDNIDNINNASDKLPNSLTLIINFYKSSTWGWCPKGTDNYGNATSSITGCGYCKESTATAQLLNQNDIIIKKLYLAKNKNAKGKNNDVLGYGSGYGVLPSFEGGVGVDCHVRILESLGYKVTTSSNSSTTVLTITEE